MTLRQAQHAMGFPPARPTPPAADPSDKAAKRAAVFDSVCKKHGFTPATLKMLPAPRVVELIRAEGQPVPDDCPVAEWLKEYAEAKAIEKTR
jgi:hypothetical protein